jgi:hypothetical protein
MVNVEATITILLITNKLFLLEYRGKAWGSLVKECAIENTKTYINDIVCVFVSVYIFYRG